MNKDRVCPTSTPTTFPSASQVLMVGTGGHARQWAQWMLELGQITCDQLLWLERPGYDGPPTLWERPVWVQDETLSARLAALPDARACFGVGCVRSAPWRWESFERLTTVLTTAGLNWASWQHPSAMVSVTARIGTGTYIGPLAVVQPEVVVGDAGLINTGAIVEHGCKLGHNVHIAPNATVCGDVTLGDHGFVGAGAVIKQGLTLPAGVTVGAGEFTKNVTSDP